MLLTCVAPPLLVDQAELLMSLGRERQLKRQASSRDVGSDKSLLKGAFWHMIRYHW